MAAVMTAAKDLRMLWQLARWIGSLVAECVSQEGDLQLEQVLGD